MKEKEQLTSEITRLRQNLRSTEQRADSWLETCEKAFVFATRAREEFNRGILERQREILRTIGVTFKITDKTLEIEPEGWLKLIQETYPALEKEYLALEPAKRYENSNNPVLAGVITRW